MGFNAFGAYELRINPTNLSVRGRQGGIVPEGVNAPEDASYSLRAEHDGAVTALAWA